MMEDYPAAHSMDTVWFAVDDVGHVGLFCSGEDGHVPFGADQDDGLELMNVLGGKEDDPDEEWSQRAARIGLFCYSYPGWASELADPYQREAIPDSPIHVDQLPLELRNRARQRCLKNMDFAEQDSIQPLEQYECALWYEDGVVGYLCSDGKTVRPIPGKEKGFAEFCKQFREENSEAAKKLIFEGIKE